VCIEEKAERIAVDTIDQPLGLTGVEHLQPVHERERGCILLGRGIAPEIEHDARGLNLIDHFGQGGLAQPVATETQVNKVGLEFPFEDRLAGTARIGRAAALGNDRAACIATAFGVVWW
jgi:hypothetical protein